MRVLEQVTREVIAWLPEKEYRYALIGGLAVSFRTIERFTKDIDLAVAVENDHEAESIEVLENLPIAVASLSGLLALKVLSVDPINLDFFNSQTTF